MRGIEIQSDIKLGQKILYINWGLVALITIIACIGFSCLYSAAGGSLSPWATPQIVRFMMGMCGMLVVALIDIRFWYKMAYPCFALGMVLLVVVEAMGHVGMGAQRWINLGFMKLQPSEVMATAQGNHAAIYKYEREQGQQHDAADKAPLLCEQGEDKVRLFFRQKV